MVGDYYSGLHIIDVSDPANPVEVGFCDTLEYAHEVAVTGNHAYVAGGDNGLQEVAGRLGRCQHLLAEDDAELEVGRNRPYGPEDGVTHTLRVHALRGLNELFHVARKANARMANKIPPRTLPRPAP